jgi:uncharacterized membrane protein YdfJ with MMPL/SSD domain
MLTLFPAVLVVLGRRIWPTIPLGSLGVLAIGLAGNTCALREQDQFLRRRAECGEPRHRGDHQPRRVAGDPAGVRPRPDHPRLQGHRLCSAAAGVPVRSALCVDTNIFLVSQAREDTVRLDTIEAMPKALSATGGLLTPASGSW